MSNLVKPTLTIDMAGLVKANLLPEWLESFPVFQYEFLQHIPKESWVVCTQFCNQTFQNDASRAVLKGLLELRRPHAIFSGFLDDAEKLLDLDMDDSLIQRFQLTLQGVVAEKCGGHDHRLSRESRFELFWYQYLLSWAAYYKTYNREDATRIAFMNCLKFAKLLNLPTEEMLAEYFQ